MHLVTVEPEEIFRALADPARIRIVRLLATTAEESCLCELTAILQEPQSKLSRHLKTLRHAGLLTAAKDGRWLYHRLVTDSPALQHLSDLIRLIPDKYGVFSCDLARFNERMVLRGGGRCRGDDSQGDTERARAHLSARA